MARESVYIDRDKMARTVMVPIYLRRKASRPEVKAGVLDASLVNVPKQALEQYEKGLEAAQSADSKKSIEYLKSAIAIYQDFGAALNELGVQYLKIGQAEKAAEVLRSAVKLKPDSSPWCLNYGIALLNKNDFEGARQQLSEAIKKNDSSATAHMYLGIAFARLKKLDEAEAELARAVSLGRNEVGMAHKYLGGIYWSKSQFKRAADELEKYLELTPKAPDAERIRGSIKELRAKSKA
ncbi:MAG: tetratricopeptide repeat protein [Pyrinomonadaceae bacterium]